MWNVQEQQSKLKVAVFTADANLWADETRIYELKNLAVQQE
jgi:hypothetical protein